MNARTTEDIVEVVDFDGREWLYIRSIPVNVAIIRASGTAETLTSAWPSARAMPGLLAGLS